MVLHNQDLQPSRWQQWLDWRGGAIQLIVLVGCWLYMIGVHWDKDGLFFQGDSPRHAMNGIFWGDLIRDGLSDPIGYTKSYYARYPAIAPTRYPPVFYFFEAVAFELFGTSVFVAKGLVHGFALASGMYLFAALRRWISPESGIFAGLLFLTPGMIKWSNAVMLNVPALAFATAALYHIRCAIDSSDRTVCVKQLRRSILFWFLAIGTHPLIGFIGLIGVSWLAMARKLSVFLKKGMLLFTIGTLITLIILLASVAILSSEQVAQARLGFYKFKHPRVLLYYLENLPEIVGWWFLFAGVAGVVLCLITKGLRPEAFRIIVAACITYFVLTSIWAVDSRYSLVACPGIVYSIAMGFDRIRSHVVSPIRSEIRTWGIMLGFLVLAITGIVQAPGVTVRNCSPMEKVVEYIESLAPSEPVIYHGTYDGTFTYYLRQGDPDFCRQVVILRKLIESSDNSIPSDEGENLRNTLLESSIRWLVVETRTGDPTIKSYEKLRKAIASSEFELFKSIPIDLGWNDRIEVYRIDSPKYLREKNEARFHTLLIDGQNWKPVEKTR